VAYNEKHNDANGEDNNDGESHNRSWNSGVEGPTDDETVNALRVQRRRNFLATLLLSQGVPMIAHGDELGRTQRGNNNVYAQDSELSWIDWADADDDLVQFTADVLKLRHDHPTFRRTRYFNGRPVRRGQDEPLPDVVWLTPSGDAMEPEDWDSGFGKSVGMYLNGDGIRGRDSRGDRVTDVAFITYFNAHDDTVTFTLPPEEYSPGWTVRIDTAAPGARDEVLDAGSPLDVPARSMIVLRAEPNHEVKATHVEVQTAGAPAPRAQQDAVTSVNPAGSTAPSGTAPARETTGPSSNEPNPNGTSR
jgi:isoamylase